jgi:hypothetical protein
MKNQNQWIFWIGSFVFLIIFFNPSFGDPLLAFYFVSFLFPVILLTSFFINQFLVPKYLLSGQNRRFSLYLIYTVIFSIYLEFLVMTVAFIILADYQIDNLGKLTGNIYFLTITLYMIVFLHGFVLSVRRFKLRESDLKSLRETIAKNETKQMIVRASRKNIPIETAAIVMIESLSDYVKIHLASGDTPILTKEKISHLEAKLPHSFIRVHRSYLINKQHIHSFDKEHIVISGDKIPIGRKYKKSTFEQLN